MRRLAIILIWMLMAAAAYGQNVTLTMKGAEATQAFNAIVERTGMNFVYPAGLLDGLKVTIDARRKPLREVLDEMFGGTDIEYKIRGKNIILKRRKARVAKPRTAKVKAKRVAIAEPDTATMLREVVVVSRLGESPAESAEMGAKKLTQSDVRQVPALLGEVDVVKSLLAQPGVSGGAEGIAGISVHGGEADQNLFMLDNVTMYQVNHFGGFFSAFNPDVIRYIDFFTTSIPAKYDGRLSSVLDVRTADGSREGYHGSGRLGLTSGAFNISGPIGRRTTWMSAVRRSWLDVLTIPFLALINAQDDEEKTRFHYYFMDLNAKVTHRFSERATGYVSVYYGDDMLKTGSKDSPGGATTWYENDKYDFNWGNLLARAGLNYRIHPTMTAEFTAAFTRFFADLRHEDYYRDGAPAGGNESYSKIKTDNSINDGILRCDFDWRPRTGALIRFGAYYTRHSFLPERTSNYYEVNGTVATACDSVSRYGANEVNVYAEGDVTLTSRLRLNAGVHGSTLGIDRKTYGALSPRLSVNYRVSESVSLKAAYARTAQYIHQLTESYLSLPTDRWVPVSAGLKPQTADKVAAGAYWKSDDGTFEATVEAFWKWMRNLLEYRDEYYLLPPMSGWSSRFTSGSGTAKGVDLHVAKTVGSLTGALNYSLAWADRQFAEKNDGKRYPARFCNRHTITLSGSWKINERVALNAMWTGHTGDRFTFMPQDFDSPAFGTGFSMDNEAPLRAPLNSYQLPFYHRLDVSCEVANSRGFWTFGLYNAYCHMNTVAIRRGWRDEVTQTPYGVSIVTRPVFQKVSLFPIIPSISYTWIF